MADQRTEEGWLTTGDGTKLYTKTWKVSGPLKALLVFIHGFSDHCNAYYNFFPSLVEHGIEVYSFDQRGWGRSVSKPAEKGLTGTTATVLDDITAFVTPLLPSDVPVFMMGHSMGGQEVLHYLATGPSSTVSQIRGFLFESPFVAIAAKTRPLGITVMAGRVASKVLPHMHMLNVIDAKLLSRDPAVQKSFVDDKLCHDTGTLEGLAGMLDRGTALETGKVKVIEGLGEGGKTRIWLSHGSGDQVTDFQASKKLFDQLEIEDKEFKTYHGWYHKLHAEPEPDCTTFANDVSNWILARSGPISTLSTGGHS